MIRAHEAMRALAGAAAGAALFFVLGCPQEGSEGKEMTIVVEADTENIQEREGQLARQWEEIEGERARLIQERQALLRRMERGDDDLSRLVAEQRRILEEEQKLRQQESLAEAERSALTEEVTRIVQAAASGAARQTAPPSPDGSDCGEEVARREAEMARREAAIAAREQALADREAALAAREAEDLRSVAAAATAATAEREPGRRVSASEVQQAHRRVRSNMRSRGILIGDLSPEVAALDRRFYQLSRAGRWEEAMDTVGSLAEAVAALSVDESFIQAKMARLGGARRGKDLTEEQGRQVEDLLAQATGAFADGKYTEANAQLNRIWAILTD